ncbi:MAG: antitoxin Xre/MbcA/ParS toxin-binding domain-containing protein [Pseudomonadota bacterium]
MTICVDMTDIVERLSAYYTPEEIDDWLNKPHPQLGGETAQAVIARGEKQLVHQIIDRLDADGYL